MNCTTFIGLDIHKDTIAIGCCKGRPGSTRIIGTIINSPDAAYPLHYPPFPDHPRLRGEQQPGQCR